VVVNGEICVAVVRVVIVIVGVVVYSCAKTTKETAKRERIIKNNFFISVFVLITINHNHYLIILL